MFQKGRRRGISQAIQRYATSNNKYMPHFNPKQSFLYSVFRCKQSVWIYND